MEPEQLIGGIVVAVILLLNILGRLMGPPTETDEPVPLPAPPRALLRDHGTRSPSVRAAAQPARHAPAAAPVARRTASLRHTLRDRRSLRNAIVLKTLLDPCRGLEPGKP